MLRAFPSLRSVASRLLPSMGAALIAVGCSEGASTGQTESDPGEVSTAIKACTAADTLHSASITDYVAQLKHDWSYMELTLDALNALTAATRALGAGDIDAARLAAAGADYEVIPLSAAQACYWVLRPTPAAASGQASLIYATDWKRDLVLEAPHAYEDRHTDVEAAQIFTRVGAKALALSGAHRCALTASSGCHASNECDKARRVPAQSDPSHSTLNGVNAMHLAFRTTDTTILQLHTNLCPELNGDALVSNGTHYAIAGTAADALGEALRGPDVDIRSCNDPAHPLPVDAVCTATGATTPFCGETSTQSLASNGAADPCLGRASSAGGPEMHRFIHLEQSNLRLCSQLTDNPSCVDTVDTWSDRVGSALAVAIAEHR